MVTTRGNVARKQSTHVKFNEKEDEQIVSDLAAMLNEEADAEDSFKDSSISRDIDSDIEGSDINEDIHDDSDDDDAPEEQSISAAKKAVFEDKRKADEAFAKERQVQREKRRQLAEHNKIQQQAKRERDQAKASTVMSLPDLLPEDFLQALDSQAPDALAPNKHLRARELDERDQRAMRQKLVEEKLAKIKSLKTGAVKKGPINVRVQKFGEKQKAVPRAESRIVNSRDQWLQRRSVKRK